MVSAAGNSLSSLLRQTTLDDPEQILGQANSVLNHSPADASARHIKGVALLKLDRYDAALQALTGDDIVLDVEAQLALAYALYKSGRLIEAQETAARASSTTRGLTHIKAQAAYRSENYEVAAELYGTLARLTLSDGNEYNDLRINRSATNVQLLWSGRSCDTISSKALMNADLGQFETAFNAACRCIVQGNLKQADVLLKRASDLCAAAEDLSDSEKNIELSSIKVQQIYVLNRLKKVDSARSVSDSLDISTISGSSTRHIAQINTFMVSSNSQNSFLCQRILKQQNVHTLADLPFKFQASLLNQNLRTLDLLMGKKLSRTQTVEAQASTNAERATVGVLNAAAYCHARTGKVALTRALLMMQLRPDDVGLLLTVLQLYIFNNNIGAATLLLEWFFARLETQSTPEALDNRYTPGLVAVLVSLYAKANRLTHMKQELAKAATHWRTQLKEKRGPGSLFKAAAIRLLHDSTQDELKLSRELFQLLTDSDQSKSVLAGLDASKTSGLKDRAGYKEMVDATKVLAASINVQALQQAGIPKLPAPTADIRVGQRAAAQKTAGADGARKAKRSKPSKAYDSSTHPDPERWLPLRDRSNWKPKGKRRGKMAAGGATQGGVVNEDSRPATPTTSQVLREAKLKKKKVRSGR